MQIQMAIEFRHVVSKSECSYRYLELSDQSGQRYGHVLPGCKNLKLAIIDGSGPPITVQRRSLNLLWSIDEWFRRNSIAPGSVVLIRLWAGRTVIHLATESGALRAAASAQPETGRTVPAYSGGPSAHRHTGAPILARLITAALHGTAGFSPLELYLLAVVACRLDWHSLALKLLDPAIAGRLEGEHGQEAEQLRAICAIRAENLRVP